jgi:hypothetical protein
MMKNMDNMIDNMGSDFYFFLAHATSMSQEELEVSSINFKDFGI